MCICIYIYIYIYTCGATYSRRGPVPTGSPEAFASAGCAPAALHPVCCLRFVSDWTQPLEILSADSKFMCYYLPAKKGVWEIQPLEQILDSDFLLCACSIITIAINSSISIGISIIVINISISSITSSSSSSSSSRSSLSLLNV